MGLRGLSALRIMGDGPAERALRVELTKAGIPLDEDAQAGVVVIIYEYKFQDTTVWSGHLEVGLRVSIRETGQECLGYVWSSSSKGGYKGKAVTDSPAESMAKSIKESMADELASDWIKAQSVHKAKKRETAIAVRNWCFENLGGGSIRGADGRTIVLTAEDVADRLRMANEVLGIEDVPAPVIIQTIRE